MCSAEEPHDAKSLVDPHESQDVKRARLQHFVGLVPHLLTQAAEAAAAAHAEATAAAAARVSHVLD